MLFISKFSNHTIIIRNALVKRAENEIGQVVEYTVRPTLEVNFKPLSLTEAERIIAVRMFTALNPEAPWGAVAYSEKGIMGQEFGDLIMDTEAYSAYNPAFNLARWDSRTDIDFAAQGCETQAESDELRRMVENSLLSNVYLNRDFIRLDEQLPKPWPAYPLEAAPGVAKKIVSLARDFGVPMLDVIDYEKTQESPRPNVIAELELEIAKEAAATAERESLGVPVVS